MTDYPKRKHVLDIFFGLMLRWWISSNIYEDMNSSIDIFDITSSFLQSIAPGRKINPQIEKKFTNDMYSEFRDELARVFPGIEPNNKKYRLKVNKY